LDLFLQLFELLKHVIDIFLHLDKHLTTLVNAAGPWTYVVLFLVIFAETGLVIIPFLPGDSLLFAVGAIAALPEANLNLILLMALMFIAAVLGDAVNYSIGKYLGPRVFSKDTGLLLNRNHLLKTQAFYDRHGGKTIILARFIPIIRTFAPFIAGVGRMEYSKFARYNVIGAFAWVLPFTVAGYFFGNLPFVKESFHYVILAIIILSVLPAVYEFMRSRQEQKIEVKVPGSSQP
jgi:membrane-associated protein